MQVRCPNCHTPIELSGDSGLSDIACPSCGSSFSLLIGEDTVPYEPRTIGLHSVLRFWDPRSGTRVGPELRNIGPCNVVRFSIDGTLCAIAQSDQTVKVLRMPQRTAKPDATIQQRSKGLPFEPSI
jgi:hypothetical protein